MAVVVGFYGDVISCQLAWQGVGHSTAKASVSTAVQGMWA